MCVRVMPARVEVAVMGKEDTAVGMRCCVVLKDRSSVWKPIWGMYGIAYKARDGACFTRADSTELEL